MIKVKITKNIIRKNKSSLGLNKKQIIIAGIAFVIGLLMLIFLKGRMSTQLLLSLIFLVMGIIIFFGVVNIQGMSLFQYMISIFKGVDVRTYESKGVFNNDIFKEKI